MNESRDIAVGIFRELGWVGASHDDIPTLPLGTDAQQRAVVEGLRSGHWEAWNDTPRLVSLFPDDIDLLLLTGFAIRCGVDARRAVHLLSDVYGPRLPDDVVRTILTERGERFVEQFIDATYEEALNPLGVSPFAEVCLRLVDEFDLPIPRRTAYFNDWATTLSLRLEGKSTRPQYRFAPEEPLIPLEILTRREPEHLRAFAEEGILDAKWLGRRIDSALERGVIDEDEAVDVVLTALAASSRPGERRVWTTWLTRHDVGAEHLVPRADEVLTIASAGEGPVVEALAVPLAAHGPDDFVPDLLMIAPAARTAKASKAVLDALATRPKPSTAEACAPLLADMVTAGGKHAKLAERLAERWDLTLDAEEGHVETFEWREPPPVWEVPRFDVGEVSEQRFSALTGKLMRRPRDAGDVTTEAYLAVWNLLAAKDPDGVRNVVAGIRDTGMGPADVDKSLHGAAELAGSWWLGSLWGRTTEVAKFAGSLPVLLSTPTWQDLRIDPAELLDRLQQYQDAGIAARQCDLEVALLRVDTTLAAPDLAGRARGITVPVESDGERLAATAGECLAAVLEHPPVEPDLELTGHHWGLQHRDLSALDPVRGRETPEDDVGYWGDDLVGEVPLSWRHVTLMEDWRRLPVVGVQWRQVVRQAEPLSPAAAIQLIGDLREPHPRAARDLYTAVREAFERGLLRPGVADVDYLDWSYPPTPATGFAAVAEQMAADGLLSVIWPVLDDLCAVAPSQPRMPAGLGDVVAMMERLLPSVEVAVESGKAAPDALALPGVRAVAAMRGRSEAVKRAKGLVERLPDVQ